MYIPEYSLTEKILNHVAAIEYSKGTVENTVIQPEWEKQLKKDADLRFIYSSLTELGYTHSFDTVKKAYDGYADDFTEVLNLKHALDFISKNSKLEEVNENVLQNIQKLLFTQNREGMYRSKKLDGHTNPEEILAEIVELFDWFNSYDAKEAYPLISAAILKIELERIAPFENMNTPTTNILIKYALRTAGYDFNGLICIEDYYKKTQSAYQQSVTTISTEVMDLTEWLQYFCEGYAIETTNLKEKIKLLGKDTKIAKVAGKTRLSDRQERIIEYLQDFGTLQNKDFSKLFPEISEDTILRNLKDLQAKGVIKKTGSTKSSRYELA